MSKTIKTPATVQELFRTARSIDVKPSDLIGIFDEALGYDWAERETQEVTLRDVPEDRDPHLNESQRPAPGIVPPGFSPWDAQWDFFKGKEMSGARWKIESDWTLETGEFALSFWMTDDDPMTATEAREYAGALLEMGVYITTMSNIMAAGAEADGVTPTPPAGYALAEGCTDLLVGAESMARGWIVTPAWNTTTDKHFMEVWTPESNQLTASEARKLAKVLLSTADAVDATGATMEAK